MHCPRLNHRITRILLLLLLAGLVGCGSDDRMDRRDERDPFIIRGDARKRAGDIDGAIEQYLKGLERRPQLALAHLKLGIEYKDHKRDYLRAIYHLQRYLEKRPDATRNALIEDLIRRSHTQYLASLPNPPAGAIEEVARLERENAMLRGQIEDLTRQLQDDAAPAERTVTAAARQPTGAAQTAQAAEAQPIRPRTPEPAVEAPAAAPRTYRVQRGDTLSRIAGRVYQDSSQWRRIFEADRGVLGTPESLREGQELIIP